MFDSETRVQDAVDAAGQIVGKGDIRAQAGQVFQNLQAALEAAGASLEHVILEMDAIAVIPQ